MDANPLYKKTKDIRQHGQCLFEHADTRSREPGNNTVDVFDGASNYGTLNMKLGQMESKKSQQIFKHGIFHGITT